MEERCNQIFVEDIAQRRMLAQRVRIHAGHDKRHATLEKELERSQNANHPQPPIVDDWDTKIDGTIIKVHSSELPMQEAFEEACEVV